MIVDLGVLEKSVLPFEFSIQRGEIDLEDETVKLESAVDVKGELKKGIVQTDVSGKISAKVLLECSRCLNEVKRNLEFPFEAAFVGPEYYSDAKEVGLNEADLNVSLIEDEKIDLVELAREQILLNLPEQVFCTEDCKGLCDKCGANRNLINCNCEEKEIDPRWAALKNLK
jgi:DUF177 domain-containing protein